MFAGLVDQNHAGSGLHVEASRDEPLAGPVVDGLDSDGGRLVGSVGRRLGRLRSLCGLRGAAAGNRQTEEPGCWNNRGRQESARPGAVPYEGSA